MRLILPLATLKAPSPRRRSSLTATYTTPDQSHAMMEPHASIAAWNGDMLTLWTANQMIDWTTADVAKTLGIPKEKVRLISPFIGGGFGAKLWLRADALLAALGARAARRPVKVALPRALVANNTMHRAATIQRIRIGATKRREDHCNRPRELVRRPARGRARGSSHADARALCRRKPPDHDAPRGARSA